MKPFVDEGRLLPRSFETINNSIDDFIVILKMKMRLLHVLV